jgi:nicotinamidase-related amidase
MSYTPLDPDNAAVLFADLQAGIIERSFTNELSHLRGAVSALAKLARLFDIPAIVTRRQRRTGRRGSRRRLRPPSAVCRSTRGRPPTPFCMREHAKRS